MSRTIIFIDSRIANRDLLLAQYDLTGGIAMGGEWELEVTIGDVDSGNDVLDGGSGVDRIEGGPE